MTLLRRINAGHDAKTIRVSIPADLADELDRFSQQAGEFGYEFPRDEVIVTALRKALTRAQADLAKERGEGTAQADATAPSEPPAEEPRPSQDDAAA